MRKAGFGSNYLTGAQLPDPSLIPFLWDTAPCNNVAIGYYFYMKRKNLAAVKLGSIKTKKKSLSSKKNGRKGGRPIKK